ncbi:MAG: right-handed parallel beta-helix repeat-containing protein, partial [Acidimicrobiales bacterium]|nr:right-handed parallel beta-helix repeat-containing protein [Acidimicrobiales bacterium]
PQFDFAAEAASVEAAAPLAAWPEMVFVDGVELRQVGKRSNVVPGTFMVDRGTDRIYLGTDPTGREVRVSWLQEALFVNNGDGSIVRGIGIRRYATSVMQQGALKVYADDALVEDVHVVDNATTGLSITGHDDEVRNVTARGNGMIGISANRPTNLVVRGSLLQGNNDEHFADIPKAGGFKTSGANGLLLENNTAIGNHANGLWTDLASNDVTVVRNIASFNERNAIEIELTGDAIVAGNVVAGNQGTGVYINETNRAKVWNNTMVDNKWAWQVVDGPRTLSDPRATGVTENIVLQNNLGAGARGESQSITQANDYTRERTGVGMGAYASNNAYYPPATGQGPAWFAIWGNYPSNPLIPKTLADLQQATGSESGSFSTPGENPFRNWNAQDFRLAAGSEAIGSGVPIPADVAAALGVGDGSIDRGALLG